MRISLQLKAIEVGVQNHPAEIVLRSAEIALRREGEIEHKRKTNDAEAVTGLIAAQCRMAHLEWYKEDCENDGDIGYYDTFKNGDMREHNPDEHRRNLGMFWDDIIKKWENHELPSDFQTRKKWIYAGNTYIRLVEPLDIAYFYRTNPNGHYISNGRPGRYKVLRKWMEEKSKESVPIPHTKQASLPEDSCFWAKVEEALKDVHNLKQGQQKLEQYVERMNEVKSKPSCFWPQAEEAFKDLENLKQGQHQGLQNLQEFEKRVEWMKRSNSRSQDMYFFATSYVKWETGWKEYKKLYGIQNGSIPEESETE